MAGLLLFFALMWSGLFGAIFNFAERVSLFIAYSIANGLQ
jgi:hypothetical protein